MRVYSGSGVGDMYYDLVRDMTEHGRKVHIQGKGDCLELPGLVVLEYHKPGYCWMRIPGRKWNPFLALAEIPWILSGNGNVDWISYFGSNMKSFQDGNNTEFHGAYGLRLRKWWNGSEFMHDATTDQIAEIVKKLKADPNSRQAVMTLWDPARDNTYHKDIPCNNMVNYTLRDGVLAQTVNIRSNDLVWGTPYNAVQFTHLHAYVAGLLGAEIGLFTYVIHNLHYYMDLYKPTLSNLIEQAYSRQELKAEKLQCFATFNDFALNYLNEDIETSLLAHRNPYPREPITIPNRKNWNSYTKQIADALRIFVKVKSQYSMTTWATEYLAELKQPLRDLFIDFYSGSSNPSAKEVVEFLRRNNDVSA